MPSLVTEYGILHYEVFGRGKPLILLHGWLESWGIWAATMEYLGEYFRTYALDFWGFGESDLYEGTYQVKDFVQLVGDFMYRLGIRRAPLVGHSMGGTVALTMAAQQPEQVEKVVVIGSPLVGDSLAWFLKLMGTSIGFWMVRYAPWLIKLFVRVFGPWITPDPSWPERVLQDFSQTSVLAFFQSIASLKAVDLRPLLPDIRQPVLGIYGAQDLIVNPNQWLVLKQHILHAQIERLFTAGHFPMLETPHAFHARLYQFLVKEEGKL